MDAVQNIPPETARGEGDFLDTYGEDARQLPEYWGRWFVPLKGGNVYRVTLSIFYFVGDAIGDIRSVTSGETYGDTALHLLRPHSWLIQFLSEMKELDKQLSMPRSKEAAENLLEIISPIIQGATDKERRDTEITHWSVIVLKQQVKTFENEFAHECQEIGVFAVTSKGDRSTKILIEDASKKFPSELLAVMPQKTIEDLQEAGRCLAFERPTACAFHICRATEALMRAYYKKLTGVDWPPPKMNKDWKVLADQLRVKGAPKVITNRLDEIRDDRNAYAHPDITVPLDEGPIVYDLCTGVMFYMAKEMV